MKLLKVGFVPKFLICIVLFSSAHVIQPTSLLEVVTIFSRYLQNPSQVGEFAPLSQSVGIELARFIAKVPCHIEYVGKRYLEAGGGCGATSVCIACAMHLEDHLDVIEIDPEMCEILKKRLAGFANVSVHCCSILDWKPEAGYDGIVSTLPFNSLGIGFTTQAIAYFKRVSNDLCMFSYVEYPVVRQVVQHFYGGDRKREFQEVQSFLAIIRQTYLIEQLTIYRNVPPITIYHLCLKP